jgi:raffinose/stachyose/melibiose transport system substrate-binding protein
MKKSIFSVLAAIVVLSMLLSACGGATDTPTAAPAAPAATNTTAPAAAAAATNTSAPVAAATNTTAPAAATNTTAPAGGATAGATAGATNTTSTNVSVATVAPDTSVSGKISILSWYAQDLYKPLLDAFQAAYPNVSIDFQNVPPANNQYQQRLQLLAGSGSLPDVFYAGPPITVMAKDGYLEDLSNLPAVKAIPAGYTSSYVYNGKTYTYAPDAWVGGAFYNKDLFSKYNVAVPQTWSDFLAACKTFHDAGITPVSMAADEIPDLVYWYHNTEVVSQDPQFDSKINTGQTTFTQGYLDALNTFKKDFVDTGYVTQDMVGLTDDQRMGDFATGKAAMTISGPWAVATFKQKNPNLNFGLFPFVGSTADKNYTVGAVNVGLSISSKTQNKPAAEAFVNFVGTPEGLSIYQKITGNFLGVPGIPYSIDPVMEPIRPYAENGKFAFAPIDWTYTATLAPMFNKGVEQIVLGTTTPDQLVKDLDAKQKELAGS